MADDLDKPDVHDDLLLPMDKLSQEDVRLRLLEHKCWLDSEGQAGIRASFFHADLRNVSFKDALLHNALFVLADLRGVNMSRADFRGVNFSGSDLSGANLKESLLMETAFIGSNLGEANLSF
ncbi:MAG TPA: pentapeptide repeat-containing protein, partial [Rhodospirillales bacterium]|nr:pentapeptide repeat-containing protein [Rhodospirillales bacterium]